LWQKTHFVVEPDEKSDVFILKELDDIYTALDESLAQINTILASRFVKPLRAKAEQWQKDILMLSDMIDAWMTCQQSWRYLENIFKAPDIQRQLQHETQQFMSVDKFFKGLMAKAHKQT
jgi:dynein heavy chain